MSDGARRARRVAKLRERDGDNCFYCGKPMLFVRPKEIKEYNWGSCSRRETVEHILDRKYGGNNSLSNLRLAHGRCNNGRNFMTVEEKMASRTDVAKGDQPDV